MAGDITKSKIVELGFSAEPKAVDDAATQIVCNINMQDVEKVVDAFKEQDELLKQAQEFSELRAKYAALEAATYKRIVDRGWEKALGINTHKCRAAKWLAKEPEKYEGRLRRILHGDATLVSLWQEEKRLKKHAGEARGMLSAKRGAIKEYKETGRTTFDTTFNDREYYFNKYIDACRYSDFELPDELFEIDAAVCNQARIELRALGAVGIGNHVYIDPRKHPDEIPAAVGIRKKNIASCINRLRELCDAIDSLDFDKELLEALSMANVII